MKQNSSIIAYMQILQPESLKLFVVASSCFRTFYLCSIAGKLTLFLLFICVRSAGTAVAQSTMLSVVVVF